MSDQRQEERKKAMIFTPVYDVEQKLLLGYLGDLTLKGAMIVGEKAVETGRNVTLAIEFREASEVPVKRLTLPARMAWCKLEEHKTHYNTGVEFIDLSDENRSVIEIVIERYKFVGGVPG